MKTRAVTAACAGNKCFVLKMDWKSLGAVSGVLSCVSGSLHSADTSIHTKPKSEKDKE